jgi:recombination protein RecA
VTTPSEDQDRALELTIAHLNKQFGKGSVIRLGSDEIEPWPAIPTGSPTLDVALGIGGLPRGRIVELWGPNGSGKSTVCLSIVVQAQRLGLRCAYADVEFALDPVYMKALGVDLDELLFSQPSNAEEALDIVDALIGTQAVGVIIVDSVAALTPKAEIEGSMSDNQMGLQARIMGKALRKITARAAESKTLVIFVNQVREKVGIVYGNPTVQPGGRALGFYASTRIELSKKEDLKSKETGEVTGIRVKAKIVKNKLAPPLRIAELDILYGEGIDAFGGLLDLALLHGVLNPVGAGYIKWAGTGEVFARSRSSAIQELRDNEPLRKELIAAIEAPVTEPAPEASQDDEVGVDPFEES